MISPQNIQQIIETARIEEVVGDFVLLKRRGVNMMGLCPFHNEKTPSFTVSPAKGIYKCFGCGKGGDSVGFVMEHENCSYPEALRWLARKYNIEIEEIQVREEHREEALRSESLYIVTEYAAKFFTEQLWQTDLGRSVGLSYFKQRGFREETIKRFQLGYIGDSPADALTRTAILAGYKTDILQAAAISRADGRDFFRNRVMFPIHNVSGKIIGFGGRIMGNVPNAPKYLNTPETELYHKSKVLYGFYFAKKAIRQANECILTEGYTDVVSLHQAGIENVVASSGTSLTVEQIQLIKRHTPNIKILYDGDAAGIKAALRGLDMVIEQSMNVKIVLLPDGEDPDSYLQKVGATSFQEYIKINGDDFILFKTKLLLKDAGNDPAKKVQLIKEIVETIAKIPNAIERGEYIKQCAGVMRIDENLLLTEVNKLALRNIESSAQKKNNPLAPEQKTTENTEADNDDETLNRLKIDDSFMAILPNEWQEKEVLKVLLLFGKEVMSDGMYVSHYMMANVEDFLEETDNPLYKRFLEHYLGLLENDELPEMTYFLSHSDKEFRQLSIALLAENEQFLYSTNWENKLEKPLQTQKYPEKNYEKEAEQVIAHFKLRKMERLMKKNAEDLKSLPADNHEDMMIILSIQMKLKKEYDELAQQLRIQGAIK